MKYIHVLESTIGRIDLDKTPKDIKGLCADGFSYCNILAIQSSDKKRYSLMHIGLAFDLDNIIEELKWIGNDGVAHLFRRNTADCNADSEFIKNNIIKKIGTKIKLAEVLVKDKKFEAIQMPINQAPFVSNEVPATTYYHPKSITLQNAFSLDLGLTGEQNAKSRFSPIISFDCENWADYKNVTISNQTKKKLKLYGITNNTSPHDLLTTILNECMVSTILQGDVSEYAQQLTGDVYAYLYLQKSTISLNDDLNAKKFLEESFASLEKYISCKPPVVYRFFEEAKQIKNQLELAAIQQKFNKDLEPALNRKDYENIMNATTTIGRTFRVLFDEFKLRSESEQYLEEKTHTYFGTATPSWRAYPRDKTKGKYEGHQLRFFNLPKEKAQNAENFSNVLKEAGFDTWKSQTSDTASVLVDLTTSKCTFK